MCFFLRHDKTGRTGRKGGISHGDPAAGPSVIRRQKVHRALQTRGYYDISASESGFELKYVLFEAAVRRSFGDVFFGTWLEKPVAFGAFEGGRLLGFVEGSPDGWNNRICTSSICVFDDFARGKGIGTRLMDVI